MAVQTLAEAAKFINDDIVAGVAEDIIAVNPFFGALPFDAYQGQGVIVNRELVMGDAGFYNVGDTITHKNASQVTPLTFQSTKIIGDAELDGLEVATSGSAGVDASAREISSKAKSVGRQFQGGMATGNGALPQMNSLAGMSDAGQTIAGVNAGAGGGALTFDDMDNLCGNVVSKDGVVDFIVMPKRTFFSYKALLRAMPGNTLEQVTLPDGRTVLAFEGIPVFRNDFLSIAETAAGAALAGGALASVYAGVFDDGSRKIGCAGIHPEATPAGITVKLIGDMENQDAELYRVKMYANFACYNRKGLARLTDISN